jgi:hypothetical protein
MYLGVSVTAWVAWTAIGTLALAGATLLLIRVTVRTARQDRERDDRKRAEDREHDDRRRAEDRERDDRLRREAADAIERRDAAERRAREDYEARQVLVAIARRERSGPGSNYNRQVTVITPHAYPIKQVEGRLVHQSNSGLSITGFGHGGDAPYTDDQRVYYGFWAQIEARDQAEPIIRFVDWHGNRYFRYKHYTERFGQNTDWLEAAQQIDLWIRTGPKPD